MATKAEYARRKIKVIEEMKFAPSEKICTKCKKLKPLLDYNNLCVGKYGKNPQCKVCCRTYNTSNYRSDNEKRKERIRKSTIINRKRKYNITEEGFQSLLKSQNYCCAICNIHLDGSRFQLKGQLDHRHSDGIIRGILCGSCNTSLGGFKDSEDLLLKAIQYLRISNTNG